MKFLLQSITNKYTPNINYENDCDNHKDGFGFAWKNKLNNKWYIYKKNICYTEDNNIKTLINTIDKSDIIIGHLRSICKKLPFERKYINTHPFKYKENIWCHNGCITNFNKFKENNINNIYNKYINLIKGQTDSEFLFYLFLSLKKDDTLYEIINSTISFFNILVKFNYKISSNIIYANDNYVLIARYINSESDCPSLYYSKDNPIIISSEPLTENFEIIENHSAIIINYNNKTIESKLELKNY